MTELGQRLGVAGTMSGRVVSVPGQPDKRRAERWIYLWRGYHDYLYFELVDGRVARADWYLALE